MRVSEAAGDAAWRRPLLLPDDAAVGGSQLLGRLRDGLDGGAPWVGIETDGTRLARDHGFALALRRLGARVQLRVAGSSERAHLAVHGRDLRRLQRRALDGCADVGLAVALVMAVLDGLNDRELGDVALLGLEHPAVRAVVFRCGRRSPRPKRAAASRHPEGHQVARLHGEADPGGSWSPIGGDELLRRLVLQLPGLLRVDHFSRDDGHRVACLLTDGDDVVWIGPPTAPVRPAGRPFDWLATVARPASAAVTSGAPGVARPAASLTAPAADTLTIVIEEARR